MNSAETNPTGETAPASAGDGLTFTTRGGPGSIYADLEAIEALTLRCETAADDAVGCAADLESVMVHLDPARCATPTVGILQDRLWDGMGEIRRLADRLFAQHRALGPTVEAYRRAEQGAAAVMDAEDPGLVDLPGLLDARAADGLSVQDSEFLLRSASEAAGEEAFAQVGEWGTGGVLSRLDPDASGLTEMAQHACRVAKEKGAEPHGPAWEAIADFGADHIEGLRLTPGEAAEIAANIAFGTDAVPWGPIEVAEPPVAMDGGPERLDGSLAAVTGLIPGVADGEGVITVTRVQRADGGESWIVALPGTQGGLLPQAGSTNWADGSGNLEALGKGSPYVADGVRRALEAAGAPAGADVMLTGFSQGGIHAVNLAQDPGFTEQYAVRGVLTVGSPNGNRPTPEDVPVLEFATDRDTYTAADGGPNPVGSQRATVTLRPAGDDAAPVLLAPGTDSRAALEAPMSWTFDADGDWDWAENAITATGTDMDRAHDLDAYTRMISGFEASDPAARSEVAPLQAALGALAAGEVISRQAVRLERRRMPAAARTPFMPGNEAPPRRTP